jgi:DNA modification methylase
MHKWTNRIITGDARKLVRALPDESADLIFTDPPYEFEYLHLYEWLAEEAARVLKPGGFCLSMCGGVHLNKIFAAMDKHLTFFWKYELILAGRACVWRRKEGRAQPIITGSKPILAYSKGVSVPRTATTGMFTGTGQDKRYHAWGQDAASSRYYVDCFSAEGDLVWDPFCGGGTTPAVCKQLKRDCISFEIDPKVALEARKRVAETQMPLLDLSCEQTAFEV